MARERWRKTSRHRCGAWVMSPPMEPETGEHGENEFHLIGSGGEHGLGREMLCSLPRSISCRLCKGEKDCPYIVDRPYGRLVIHKRKPESLVVRDLVHVATGSGNSAAYAVPNRQKAIALVAWTMVPILVGWVIFVHRPSWTAFIVSAGVMLATFGVTIIGVPIVRWFWRDHGGSRRGGAWHPS